MSSALRTGPLRPDAPVPGRSGRSARRSRSTLRQQEARVGLALMSPALIVVIVIVVLPIAWTILLAFQRVRLINIRRAGLFGDYTLGNIADVFTSSGFLRSLLTTLIYSMCGTSLSIAIGLIAALALRRPFRGRMLVRALMLLPYVAPVVAVTFVWQTMLSPQFGIVNHWGTRLLGWDDPIAFLSQRTNSISLLGLEIGVPTALLTVIVFEAWRYFPFAFLFLTARLQALPGDVEEAALIDGATPLQRFQFVILPQLMPVVALLAVLRFIWTFNEFDDIYLLTGGGAGTEVVSVRVFNFLTARGDIGVASAQALVLAVVLICLITVYLRRFAGKVEGA